MKPRGWRHWRSLVSTIGGVIVLSGASGTGAPRTGPVLPGDLETYVTKYVHLDADARARLLAGAPITKLLDSDPSKEVVVFGAVWVHAPIARYLAAVKDIERFESGDNFLVTKKVSSPPRLDDFAQLRITDDDARDMRSCKVSSCEFKLSEGGIERLRREVDWTRPDAHERLNRLAREFALEYVTGYLEGGNARLAVYRDEERPTFVAQEFATMIDRLPSLGEFLPQVRRYLLEFPKATLPSSESFIYWQEVKFGLKPTIRINHLVMAEEKDGAMVASKMLYASHYFWTALELRVLVRDPSRGEGFWFVTESRSRSDGLSGFVGRLIRGKVRGEAEKGTAAVLQLTRDRLEKP
jgi:hypothetical protein